MVTHSINIHITSSYTNPNYIQVLLKEKMDQVQEYKVHEYKNNELVLYILNKNYKRHLDYEYLGGHISKEMANYGSNFIIDLKRLDKDEAAYVINGVYLASYTLDLFKTKKGKKVENVIFLVNDERAVEEFFVQRLKKTSDGNLFARRLCYLPPNVLTPAGMVEEIKKLFANEPSVKIEVLDKEEIKRRNMNLIYSVGMGSTHDPYVVIIHKGENPNVALLGKGVTFDTGGISLKPSDSMIDMKKDMAGAASVVGAVYATEYPVIGMVALVENMIDSRAQRVSDIWTAMSGDTVEILNTDAEGRLLLGDLMTLAQTYSSVKTIVDLATLTGAVGIALGKEYGAIMGNNNTLNTALIESGKETGDLLWALPCGEEYNHHLESTIADVKNVGTKRESGVIAGAKFIEFFLKNKEICWAHLDIASVIEKRTPLSSNSTNGFGVRLLKDFMEKAGKKACCVDKEKCCN